jgi:hypothetical protein
MDESSELLDAILREVRLLVLGLSLLTDEDLTQVPPADLEDDNAC